MKKLLSLWYKGLAETITKLTDEQAEYINVPVDGPFKEEEYKYNLISFFNKLLIIGE